MPEFRSGKPRLRVSLSADVVLTAGFHVIPFDVVDHEEPAGIWGVSSFVATRPGAYLVTGVVQRRPIAVSSGVTARIAVNGVGVASVIGVPTTAVVSTAVTDVLELATGDVVALEGQGSAANGWTLGFSQSRLAIVRIAPERWT